MNDFMQLYNQIPRPRKLEFCKLLGYASTKNFTNKGFCKPFEYKVLCDFLEKTQKYKIMYVPYDFEQVEHYKRELCNYINSASFTSLSSENKLKILNEKNRLVN